MKAFRDSFYVPFQTKFNVSPPLTAKAKRTRKKRAPLTEEQRRSKYERWLEKAREIGKAAAAKQEYDKYIANLPPMPCPRLTVLELARSGDEYAQWRADELYGSGWRATAQVEA